MKAFIFAYDTNYDLGSTIIYADNKKEAIKLAKNCDLIWDTNNIYEIELPDTPKIIYITSNNFIDITNEYTRKN